MGLHQQQQYHFLIVTYPVQSHINPALHLARRLSLIAGSHVTFSTSASAHLLMFPNATSTDQEITEGDITYVPYYTNNENNKDLSPPNSSVVFDSNNLLPSSKNLSCVLTHLATRGRPVTCLIYTVFPWAADVARDHGIPSAQYWIQPATTFASYYHYFHGYAHLVDSHCNQPNFPIQLPGLPPMQIRDLPSFILGGETPNGPYSTFVPKFKEAFERYGNPISGPTKPRVLVNTFDELEPSALTAVEAVEMISIGPIVSDGEEVSCNKQLFKPDEKRYMEWLDSKEEGSVVYVSFGSISVLKKLQIEEIFEGLKASGRPYLWVVRKDSRQEGMAFELEENIGMVVEWCSQARVLRHPSVGCFVTHCGWNSTMESMVCGVPAVGMPQWADQGTNVMMMEKVWGNGVRPVASDEGLVQGKELRRCLDLVMGDGERGELIRRNAQLWKEKARESVSEGGKSYRNLKEFVEEIALYS